MSYHIAQVNIAVARYQYDDAEFADFVDNLDRINGMAEASPGFVWRYVSDDDDAEARRIFNEPTLLFNMSLWESVDALRRFVYESDHLGILRRRAEWFVPQSRPVMALWWQPVGRIPTITESKHRLECLGQLGPSPEAFTFRSTFDPPDTLAAAGEGSR